ncbi:MAG TPA: hypothetical protein PLC81_09150 [Bacteroidales bacterium]|nr:hypothetical protein [Bacteroidales bacterium]HQK37791.1 hypothetical protein [Bacteroidales bacterium]
MLEKESTSAETLTLFADRFFENFALAGGSSMHFKWKTAFQNLKVVKRLIYFEDVDAGGWPVLLKKRI